MLNTAKNAEAAVEVNTHVTLLCNTCWYSQWIRILIADGYRRISKLVLVDINIRCLYMLIIYIYIFMTLHKRTARKNIIYIFPYQVHATHEHSVLLSYTDRKLFRELVN